MMKYLLGAAAAAALIAPGAAAAETSGNVAFSYNSLDDDLDPFREDFLSLSGDVVTSLGGNWNLQFSADMADMNHTDHTHSFGAATVNAFWRDDSFALGGFAGIGNDDGALLMIGANGAAYLGRFTLSGTAYYAWDREASEVDASSIGAQGTYFFTDTFSVGADANYHEFNFPGASIDGSAYGLNAEYQFAGTAFSVFGGWHWSEVDYFGLADSDANSGTIGVRYNFGTDTLIQRDRSGASMPGADTFSRDAIARFF